MTAEHTTATITEEDWDQIRNSVDLDKLEKKVTTIRPLFKGQIKLDEVCKKWSSQPSVGKKYTEEEIKYVEVLFDKVAKAFGDPLLSTVSELRTAVHKKEAKTELRKNAQLEEKDFDIFLQFFEGRFVLVKK